MCGVFAGWFQPSPALQSPCPAPTASAEPVAAQPFLLSYPSWLLPLECSWVVQQCAKSQRWALSHGTTKSTDGVWRQCLVAAFPALVCLAPQRGSLILCFQNRITSIFLTEWSGLLINLQRLSAGRELYPSCSPSLHMVWGAGWWKAHPLRACWAVPGHSAVHPAGLGAALDQPGLLHTSAALAQARTGNSLSLCCLKPAQQFLLGAIPMALLDLSLR